MQAHSQTGMKKQLIIQIQDVWQMCCSTQQEHFIDLLSVKPAANEGLWFSVWLLMAKIRCSTVCILALLALFVCQSVCLCTILEVWCATIWWASDLEWVQVVFYPPSTIHPRQLSDHNRPLTHNMTNAARVALSFWPLSCLFLSFLSLLFSLCFCLSVDTTFPLPMEPKSWPAKLCNASLTKCDQPLAL